MPMSLHAKGRRAADVTRSLSFQAIAQRFGAPSWRIMGFSIPSILLVGTISIRVASRGARRTTNPRFASTFRQGSGTLRASCMGMQRSLTTCKRAPLSPRPKATAPDETQMPIAMISFEAKPIVFPVKLVVAPSARLRRKCLYWHGFVTLASFTCQ